MDENIKKWFRVLVIAAVCCFVWSGLWMNNILKNEFFYFQWAADSRGYFSQGTLPFKLTVISGKLNLIFDPLFKGAALLAGLKLIYECLRSKFPK